MSDNQTNLRQKLSRAAILGSQLLVAGIFAFWYQGVFGDQATLYDGRQISALSDAQLQDALQQGLVSSVTTVSFFGQYPYQFEGRPSLFLMPLILVVTAAPGFMLLHWISNHLLAHLTSSGRSNWRHSFSPLFRMMLGLVVVWTLASAAWFSDELYDFEPDRVHCYDVIADQQLRKLAKAAQIQHPANLIDPFDQVLASADDVFRQRALFEARLAELGGQIETIQKCHNLPAHHVFQSLEKWLFALALVLTPALVFVIYFQVAHKNLLQRIWLARSPMWRAAAYLLAAWGLSWSGIYFLFSPFGHPINHFSGYFSVLVGAPICGWLIYRAWSVLRSSS